MLGLGMNHIRPLQAAAVDPRRGTAKSCVYIFLSGGLSQHESFDPKPNAPDTVRGEFKPIATRTAGFHISEHLPKLAACSDRWSVVRSLTHSTNDHTLGHYLMLTGRNAANPGFRGDRAARPSDWPSIASVAGETIPTRPRNNLPPSIVLPERLVHWSGGVIPGAYGGEMGAARDPFFIEASPYGDPFWRGAYPEYTFANETKKPPKAPDARVYRAPSLSLSPGLTIDRLRSRVDLMRDFDDQRGALEQAASVQSFDRDRQEAVALLASEQVRRAFDVTRADDAIQERYGRNSFGWSLLMAFRLVEAGVPFVQVNLGNNETWDTHGEIFHRLKNKLLPPTEKALSAMMDDLQAVGLFDSTMIVMAGEFGRTPKLSTLGESYDEPGRDHWGAVQSVFFAGGGVQGGRVIGSSDAIGAYPATEPVTPADMAATIYQSLGIPSTAAWKDESDRPHHVYHGRAIEGLF